MLIEAHGLERVFGLVDARHKDAVFPNDGSGGRGACQVALEATFSVLLHWEGRFVHR